MDRVGHHRGGTGEPLVLIHGFSGTWRVWEPVLPALAAAHDVLAVTLAGHVGGSELPPSERTSVDALVDAVEADMDRAGLQSAHLAGNSLGGWIALELARRGRGRSVVALSPAGGWEQGSRAEARLRRLFTRSHRLGSLMLPHLETALARPRLRRLLLGQAMARADLLEPALAAEFVRDSVACPIYFDLMDAILREGPPMTLAGISCPVLLAWGTRDRILPARTYSRRMRELVPAAAWRDLPRLGHIPMADDRELVARTIIDFAASAPERAFEPQAAGA